MVLEPLEPRQAAQAVALSLEAVRRASNNASYVNTLGTAYYRNGEDQKAIQTLLRSGELNPNGLTAGDMFFLTMAHQRLGQTEKAKDFYARSLAWRKDHSGQLSAAQVEQLASFQAEAEKVLSGAQVEKVR